MGSKSLLWAAYGANVNRRGDWTSAGWVMQPAWIEVNGPARTGNGAGSLGDLDRSDAVEEPEPARCDALDYQEVLD